MLTNVSTTADLLRLERRQSSRRRPPRKWSSSTAVRRFSSCSKRSLDAGHYDVVFVESSQHAYSQIKRVQPNLVILCVRIEDADGFQVLSMLKLDEETRTIPVLTYTTESDGDEARGRRDAGAVGREIFVSKPPAVWMN